MGKLKVVKAAYAGACYGVQRALDMTLKAAEAGGSVCTLGPLIHNPGVVAGAWHLRCRLGRQHRCRWGGYPLSWSGASGYRRH